MGELIRRQDVLDLAERGKLVSNGNYKSVCDAINGLQSVEPERKPGKWIEKEDYSGDVYYDCSVCGNSWTTIDGTPWENGMNYCPNCGARMEVDNG